MVAEMHTHKYKCTLYTNAQDKTIQLHMHLENYVHNPYGVCFNIA